MSATAHHNPPPQRPVDRQAATTNLWSRDRYLPDRGYWRRVFRRQWLFFVLVFLSFITFANLITSLDRPLYQARVTAVYDQQALIDPTPNSTTGFIQIATQGERQLNNEAFLLRLVSLGASPVGPRPLSSLINKKLALLFPQLGPSEASVRQEQRWLAQALRNQLTLASDASSQTLSIIAKHKDPKIAQFTAQQAMEILILDALSQANELTTSRVEALRTLYERETTRMRDVSVAKPSDELPSQTTNTTSVPSHEELLRREEQEIELRVQRLKASLATELSAYNTHRAALEAELARLGAQLTPFHPDYIAKQEELRQLPRGPDADKLNQELTELMKQQVRVRAEMRRLGLPPSSLEIPAQSNLLLARLEDQWRTTEVEAMSLREQLSSPNKRLRLRVLEPAALEYAPAKTRRDLVLSVLGLCLITALTACGAREVLHSRADDPWHLRRRLGLPIVFAIKRRSLRLYARLSRSDLMDLRRAAIRSLTPSSVRHRHEMTALVEFRNAARALGIGLDPSSRPTLLLPVSLDDRTADAFVTIFNLYGDECAGKTLVIDLADRDPLASQTDGLSPLADITEFLAGRAPWRDIRLEADERRATALVPPPSSAAILDGATRSIRTESLRQLCIALAKGYQHIFVRGMSVDQPLVNRELIAAAGEIFVVCDGRRSTYEQVRCMVAAVPADKIRGLILIGGLD